jgi:poly(A) polymerase
VRVRADRGVSPAFLFAAVLWHVVLVACTAATERGARPAPALFDAMDKVLSAQAERIAIPRRFEATIKEVWALQPRFEQRAGSRPARRSSSSRLSSKTRGPNCVSSATAALMKSGCAV